MLLLDIQASLCRLHENAVVFADNGGIETTIRIIHQFDYDVGLLTLGTSSGIRPSARFPRGAGKTTSRLLCCEFPSFRNSLAEYSVSTYAVDSTHG